jgi:hypothetical protein
MRPLRIFDHIIYTACRMPPSGMLRSVALVGTDFSKELSASIIRVTRIGELGTTLAVTSNRRMLRRNTNLRSYILLVFGHFHNSPSVSSGKLGAITLVI